MLLAGAEVQSSPHRVPAPAAWLAGRAYLAMLSLSGAGAYGILQPAAVGLVLTNIRSWCRNSNVHRPGGGSTGKGGGAGLKGAQKRRHGAGGTEDASDDEDSEGEAEGGGRRGEAGLTRSAGGGAGEVDKVMECLRHVKACLDSVPLASHQVPFFSFFPRTFVCFS